MTLSGCKPAKSVERVRPSAQAVRCISSPPRRNELEQRLLFAMLALHEYLGVAGYILLHLPCRLADLDFRLGSTNGDRMTEPDSSNAARQEQHLRQVG